MIKVGINGFGRIGRAITRIISDLKDINVAAINDIDDDTENLSYLLRYDTIYGKFKHNVKLKSKNNLLINDNTVQFYSESMIDNVCDPKLPTTRSGIPSKFRSTPSIMCGPLSTSTE